MWHSPIGPLGVGVIFIVGWIFSTTSLWRILWMAAFLVWTAWITWVAARTQNWILLTIPGVLFAISVIVAAIKKNLAPED